jgi:SRSO17 transposase
LYLPKAWTDDPVRMAAAHVPDGRIFATRPALAVGMVERAIAAGVPFAWVAADSVYEIGDVETALRRAGKGYVLGVNSSHHFRSWQRKPPIAGTAEEIAGGIDPARRQRLSAGDGTKGARLHDRVYCELADLDAAEYDTARIGLWTRGLLIRRNIADGDLAFFSTWCPAGTGIEMLVKIEGHRWAIEDSFETAKKELGLDHNETRSWHGWHRHVSLVMLAFAMVAAIQHRANAATPPKKCAGWRTTLAAIDPLVGTGNPAHCRQARATTHPACQHHRMVTLATGSSSLSSKSILNQNNATVMLGQKTCDLLTWGLEPVVSRPTSSVGDPVVHAAKPATPPQ